MAPTIPIDLDRASDEPLYRQIEWQLRLAISDGRLRPGSLVPGARTIAATLGVARITVATAYENLAAEGFVEGIVGVGTRVALDPPTAPRPALESARRETIAPPAIPFVLLRGPGHDGRPIDLRPGAGRLGQFPFATWERMLRDAVRELADGSPSGPDPGGDPVLREHLAIRLAVARGIRADPAHVFVTTGDWASLSTVADLWIDQHAPAIVEDPGETYVRRLLGGRGRAIELIGVDDGGIRPELLPEATPAGQQPVLLHVNPAWQPVRGGTLPPDRRRALFEWADGAGPDGLRIIEDDRDAELRLAGPLPPSLLAVDRNRRVFHVRGLERDLLPGLRIGYLVAPPDAAPRVAGLLELQGRGPGAIEQRALAGFLAGGHFDRHLRRARRWLAERHDVLIDAIETEGDGVLAARPAVAGRHLVVGLAGHPARTATAVAERARRAGLRVETLASRRVGPGPDRELLVTFAIADLALLREGVRRLVVAARERPSAPIELSRGWLPTAPATTYVAGVGRVGGGGMLVGRGARRVP